MSISKVLRVISIGVLAPYQVCQLIKFSLAPILWSPQKRITEFCNIVKRKPFSRAGKPPPVKWTDPTLGQHGFLHVNGLKLHYVASGDENKPLMIFLHGYLDCWYTWRYQIREFQKSYRVVAIDLRGYSLSDCPEGKSHYTIEKNVSDIAEVIKALGYKDSILVGNGWGAIIATMTASRFPEKISKLIVFNFSATPAFNNHFGEELADAKLVSPHLYARIPYIPEFMLTSKDFKSLEKFFFLENSVRKENLTEEDLEIYKYALSQKGVIYAALHNFRSMITSGKDLWIKGQVDWNILLMHVAKDAWIKQVVINDSKQYFPNGVFKSVKGVTQYMHEDKPLVVNEIITEFLNKEVNKE